MKFRFPLPTLSSSRKARSKALTLSVVVGVITFVLATIGGRLATGKVTSVVVAATDLQPGQVLTDKDLNDAGKISGILPPDVFTDKSKVVGLSLDIAVKAGQPLIKDLVSKTPLRDGLYPGEVGVWVSVTLTTSGLAKPGDLVDVYLSSPSSQYGKVDAPQMVNSLQGIRVVAAVNGTAQPVKSDASNPNGNVPAAIELAIPKSQAGEFSSIAAGKVSLMLDPFANPQLTSDARNVFQGSNVSYPPSAPNLSAPSNPLPNNPATNVAQPTSTTNAVGTPTQSPTNVQQPNSVMSTPNSAPNAPSGTQASESENYTPQFFNPASDNSQNK
jgi:pilus assembly protein CpaB